MYRDEEGPRDRESIRVDADACPNRLSIHFSRPEQRPGAQFARREEEIRELFGPHPAQTGH
jgi:hypothetical protein